MAKTAGTNSAPAPAISGTFTADRGEVVVDILASDSGFVNLLYYSTDNFLTRHFIGIDNQVGSVSLGTFAKGTVIEFGILVNDQLYRTGVAADNPDNVVHAAVSSVDGATRIGFEDLDGGGDLDFNDAIINVRNLPLVHDNRSGLGDGTNPGQGAGRDNSPNEGTSNPGAVSPEPTVVVAAPPPEPAPEPAATEVVVATGTFVAGSDEVMVYIRASDSGYDDTIYYSTDNFQTRHFIGIDNHVGAYSLGTFAPGTVIEFGILSGVGQFFRTGGASVNSDNVDHTLISEVDGGIQIGFEDLYGGGDLDYNDVVIVVGYAQDSGYWVP